MRVYLAMPPGKAAGGAGWPLHPDRPRAGEAGADAGARGRAGGGGKCRLAGTVGYASAGCLPHAQIHHSEVRSTRVPRPTDAGRRGCRTRRWRLRYEQLPWPSATTAPRSRPRQIESSRPVFLLADEIRGRIAPPPAPGARPATGGPSIPGTATSGTSACTTARSTASIASSLPAAGSWKGATIEIHRTARPLRLQLPAKAHPSRKS